MTEIRVCKLAHRYDVTFILPCGLARQKASSVVTKQAFFWWVKMTMQLTVGTRAQGSWRCWRCCSSHQLVGFCPCQSAQPCSRRSPQLVIRLHLNPHHQAQQRHSQAGGIAEVGLWTFSCRTVTATHGDDMHWRAAVAANCSRHTWHCGVTFSSCWKAVVFQGDCPA